MRTVVLVVLALQGAIMLIDEVRFHRRRSLPRWERIGHPIDTASVLGCCLVTLFWEPTRGALSAYAVLGVVSCLLVTKDEFVHAARCEAKEHWLHALLFVLHPLLLIGLALLWFDRARAILVAQTLATTSFALYQLIYWNLLAAPPPHAPAAPRAVHQESD